MFDTLYRFDGLRRAVFEIQKAIAQNVPSIHVQASPGAGLTTLLLHIAGFDSMGDVPTRFFWDTRIGNWSADESVWLVQDAVAHNAKNLVTATLVQRQSPKGPLYRTLGSAVVLLNPMNLGETRLYLSWRRRAGIVDSPMTAFETERLHRQCGGCIGKLTRQLTSQARRKAA